MVRRQVEFVVFEFFRHGLLVDEDLVTHREHGIPVGLGLRQADLSADVSTHAVACLPGTPYERLSRGWADLIQRICGPRSAMACSATPSRATGTSHISPPCVPPAGTALNASSSCHAWMETDVFLPRSAADA